jgi:hypothetical protein
MDPIDKFLKQYSYKFPKGYPDMKNEQDILLMETLLENFLGKDKPQLKEATTSYDSRILQILSADENIKSVANFPKCKEKIKVGTDFELSGQDLAYWKTLYPIKPLKMDNTTPTSGAGNGEIALYWAFQYNENPVPVEGDPKGDAPDLIIDGVGVEVKSYNTSTIKLGKFAKDSTTVALINKVLSINSLFSEIGEKPITAGTGNFKSQDLVNAFKILDILSKNKDLQKLELTKPLFDRIDIIYKSLKVGDDNTPKELTAALLRQLLFNKLMSKPRMGKDKGYIANVSEDGKVKFYEISDTTLNNISDENILAGVEVKSSEIAMNFPLLFK